MKRIYDLLNAKPNQSFFTYRIQSKEKLSSEKSFLKEKGKQRVEKKIKRRLFNCFRNGDYEGPTASIRKHAIELKVHEKTMKTAIKQDLSSDHKTPVRCMRRFTKTKAASHPNIGSLKNLF